MSAKCPHCAETDKDAAALADAVGAYLDGNRGCVEEEALGIALSRWTQRDARWGVEQAYEFADRVTGKAPSQGRLP